MKAIAFSLQDQTKPHYLLIDEINRGDCSAIFGDVFQLLDRKEDGSSEYGIELRPEAAEWLSKKVADWDETEKGKLRIPRNLSIFGTMNTSDQNLYPMDTAFKRRWEWESCSVEAEYKEFKKEFSKAYLNDGRKKWDWLALIKKLNDSITNASNMEDKQIGPWFLKPIGTGEVCETIFSNKLLSIFGSMYSREQDSPNSPSISMMMFGPLVSLSVEFSMNGLEGIFKEDLPELSFKCQYCSWRKAICDLHPKTDEGEQMDATFDVHSDDEFGTSIVFRSHSGGGPNADYDSALATLLSRLARIEGEIIKIMLAPTPGRILFMKINQSIK